MSRSISGAIAALALLAGCRDIGSVASPGIYDGEPLLKDEFVVDAFSVQCTVKVNPGTQSLRAYFPVTFRYQFKGHSGSIDEMTFVPVGFTGTHLFISPLRPDSVGKICEMNEGFWSDSSIASLDSVAVRLSASGAHWELVSGKARIFSTFAWGADQKVAVRHQ